MSHAYSSAYSQAFDVELIPRGNWYKLVEIIDEARDIEAKDRSGTPTSCAVDYTALRAGEDGKLFCPWCGLVWPDEASAWGSFPGAF